MEYYSVVQGENVRFMLQGGWTTKMSSSVAYQIGRFHACEIPRAGDSLSSRAEEMRDWTVSGLKTYLKLNRCVWMASWMYLHATKILNTIKAHFTLHECCWNQKGKILCQFFFFKQNQWGWKWDVAHWVRAPNAYPEDLCSIFSVHIQFSTAYNSSSRQPNTLFWA